MVEAYLYNEADNGYFDPPVVIEKDRLPMLRSQHAYLITSEL